MFISKDSFKDGWRRTKQTTKVKLGKADETHDDEEYDKLVVECKEHYALLKRVSAAIIVHATAVNAATSSGSALAIELNDLYSDVGAEHRPAVVANTVAWQQATALEAKRLDRTEVKVVEPIKAHLEEFQRLGELWELRGKRRQDFDYYRSKTTELEKRRTGTEKNVAAVDEKIARNEAKLRQSREVFEALTSEVRTRMRELISERFHAYGAPLTQLLAAERGYHVGIAAALEPLGKWTGEAALSRAAQQAAARPSRRRLPAAEGSFTSSAQESRWVAEDDGPTAPVVTMDELQGGQLSPPAAQPSAKPPSYAARSAESDPWAPQAEQPRPAQPQPQPRPQPVVDLLGGDSNDPFGAPAPPSAPQPQPAPAVDIMAALASSAAPTAAAPAGDRYKALTDYAPGDPRMLALKKGDLLTKEREEDGWFFGANDRGQSGYFPPNYCKKVV